MAEEAYTKIYENAGVQFTAITGQDTQINKLMRTFQFNYKI
jgi:hypothetical protein